MTDLQRLVSRMDLDQKIAQLQGVAPMDLVDHARLARKGEKLDLSQGFPYDIDRLPEVRPHGVGHLSMGLQLDHDISRLRSALTRFQAIARELSPFGMAALVHAEAINGLVHPQGHQFPTAWGQAAELGSGGDPPGRGDRSSAGSGPRRSPVLLTPARPGTRSPLGRVHETYGEDPELVTRMALGFISGVQGADGNSGLLATGKHFLGYAHSLGALNQAATQLGRRELTDIHAQPFRRAIAEAGLRVVMNSYNEVDGVPAAANSWLLSDLLRGTLGFDGLVVSDYDAITMLHRTYRTAPSPGHAAAQALSCWHRRGVAG